MKNNKLKQGIRIVHETCPPDLDLDWRSYVVFNGKKFYEPSGSEFGFAGDRVLVKPQRNQDVVEVTPLETRDQYFAPEIWETVGAGETKRASQKKKNTKVISGLKNYTCDVEDEIKFHQANVDAAKKKLNLAKKLGAILEGLSDSEIGQLSDILAHYI